MTSLCCEKMEETVDEGEVYLTENKRIFFPFDGAYDGREFIQFCPWCGTRIDQDAVVSRSPYSES